MSSDKGFFIKVLSLVIGLTIGLILIAKIETERNYDSCILEKERVYELSETFCKRESDPQEYNMTPGGAVVAMRHYIPEIEVGTRWTTIFGDEKLITEDGIRHNFEMSILADSCFFDIFGTTILQGNAREILAIPGQCLISKRLYDRIGADIFGKTFCYMASPNTPVVVAGVFEDFEENSRLNTVDIVMSLPSIGSFIYDGSENMIGNDRYCSYVRLCPDADMDKVVAGVNTMLKEQLPWDELRAAGIEDYGFALHSVLGSRMQDSTVRTTCIILFVVSLVMFFTSVMNYILVVISQMVGKARQVALRKVLGAPTREFYLKTLKEAVVHLLLALIIMALLLYAFRENINDLMGVGLATLFSSQTYYILIGICMVVLLCCGLLPGYIYSRIPVVYAYRLFSENKRVWKLSLLAFQFVLSTMLLCILSTIFRQYSYMLDKDLGYDYENVAYIEIYHPSDSTYVLAREIEKLPCVESASASSTLFLKRQGGNNVMLPECTEQLFNFACCYWAESSIIKTMGLTIVEGQQPTSVDHPGWTKEAIVDEKFADQLKIHTGWSDVIGQTIVSTEFGHNLPLIIKCVVKDFQLGSLVQPENRPAMMLNGNIWANYILIKLNSMTSENLMAVQQACDNIYPDAELVVKRYSDELVGSYMQTQRTRDLIMIGCLACLLITIVGLIGYVRDEVQRRSRELAIRKVLGAKMSELQRLFLRSISVIAIPSAIVGLALGWYLSNLLMEQFADKVQLLWYVFVADILVVLTIIFVVVYLQTRKIANNNPIDYIKTE